jgi:hypothetical protein
MMGSDVHLRYLLSGVRQQWPPLPLPPPHSQSPRGIRSSIDKFPPRNQSEGGGEGGGGGGGHGPVQSGVWD